MDNGFGHVINVNYGTAPHSLVWGFSMTND
jgi:hypothetical protein